MRTARTPRTHRRGDCLVDELRMFRNPVVVGGGTPFLPPVTEDVPLDLIETRTFGSRVIYERYGRARDESD
jgi:riboflavin biosynthesis pyrimidine reductase